jgi:hypothetical protein
VVDRGPLGRMLLRHCSSPLTDFTKLWNRDEPTWTGTNIVVLPVLISTVHGHSERWDMSSNPKVNLCFEENFMIHFVNKSGIWTPKLKGQILNWNKHISICLCRLSIVAYNPIFTLRVRDGNGHPIYIQQLKILLSSPPSKRQPCFVQCDVYQ